MPPFHPFSTLSPRKSSRRRRCRNDLLDPMTCDLLAPHQNIASTLTLSPSYPVTLLLFHPFTLLPVILHAPKRRTRLTGRALLLPQLTRSAQLVLSSFFTIVAISAPSARPASCLLASPITRPISAMLEAPVEAMTSFTMACTSDPLMRCGR